MLVPTEDDRWDADLRLAALNIQRREFAAAVQILQEVIDDAPASRALKAVTVTSPPGPPEGAVPSPPPGTPEGAVVPSPPDSPEEAQPREELEDELVPSGETRVPARPGITLYIPVQEVARQLLADLPPEGVAVYRRLCGALAEDLHRKAVHLGDRELLLRLAEDYFLTDAGSEAGQRLAEACFEEGRFWAAVSWWRRCLSTESGVRKFATRLKVLKALRFLAEETAYDAEKAEFLAGNPGEDLLAQLSTFEAAHPMPKGATAVAAAPGLPPGPPPPFASRRVGFDWNSFFWARKGIPRVGSSARGPGERRSVILSFERETARAFPFFPAFGPGGEAGYLYLSAPFTVQRLSVASGKAERPLYAIPPPGAGEQGKSAPLNFQERSESPVYAATLAVFSPPVPPEGAVASSPAGAVPGVPAEGAGAPSPLPPAASRQPPASGEAASPAGTAILVTSYVSDLVPFRHYMGYEITADIPTRSLVAFDADTGKPLWWTSDLSLGGERKPVSFTTPALLRGGRVFAGGWQPHGYLDGVLVALDQNDGRVLWHQLVASSQMEGTMFGELAREPFASLLAEREGVLYYSTNLGAIAALSAGTGRILWMTTYDSIPVKPADGRRSEFRRIVWGANPLLFVGETLIVTPRDSLHLYAIDCSTVPSSNSSAPDPVRGAGAGSRGRQGGRILWSYSNAAGDLRDLLGYAEGRLYFTGPGGVQALDISETPLKAPRKIPGPIPRSDEGRGALTDSGVVLVARVGGPRPEIGQRPEGESRLWLVDFSLKNRIDLSGPLPPPDSLTYGGNVTVKDGRIFLTSRDLVAAYSPRPELGDVPGEARPPLTGKSSEPPLEKSEEEEHP